MIYNVKDIKVLRKTLGITQSQLAKSAGVSQSLIAKIEAEKVDAAHSYVMKIFAALDRLSNVKELTAAEIMTKSIAKAEPENDLKTLIKKMRSKDISQVPVLEKGQVVGLVTETAIIDSMSQNAPKVRDVMQSPPPIIAHNTGREALADMLRFFPILVVQEKGKILGVITKSDIIASMFR